MIHIYIDEAGRWPLAGPVYVGLVLWKKSFNDPNFQGFKDSKKLSRKQRDMLFMQLEQSNISWAYWNSSAKYIDHYGIVAAIRQAIIKGIQKILYSYCELLGYANIGSYTFAKFCDSISTVGGVTLHIDGNTDFGLNKKFPWLTIITYIKGDDRIPAISAASIIAKVLRDRKMVYLDKKYPNYWFAQHKWYGTVLHREHIKNYGLSSIHRQSFCKTLL
jgi:ribonuclease HII